MEFHGSCQCGAITFEAEIGPARVWACHCTDCQAGSGSAYRVNVAVAGESFKLLTGVPSRFVKTTAESGTPREQAFCPACGSPIFSTNVGDVKASYTMRVGLFAERHSLQPKVQNWVRSALPWAVIPGLPCNDKGATH
jgi:hypothetical protein